MAESAKERIVLIAMDGSEYSDYAFDCKLFYVFLGGSILFL